MLSKKIFSNTVWQMSGRIVDVLLGVVTLGLITRTLGQQSYGYYTTISAWLQVFAIVVDLGLYLTLLRLLSETAKEHQTKLINAAVSLRLLTSGIVLLISLVAIWFTPYPSLIKEGTAILALSYVSASLVTVLTALFQYHLKMSVIAISSSLQKVVTLLLTIIAISLWSHAALLPLLWVSTIASLLQLVFVFWAAKSYIQVRFTVDRQLWMVLLKKTWPIALTTALNLVYFKMDTVILSWYRSADIVGLYGASYRVLEIITTFPHMFMGLVLAPLTEAWVNTNHERLLYLWKRCWEFFALLVIPLVVGGWLLARPIMIIVAGEEFGDSGPILQILLLATAAIFFGVLFTYMVLVVDRQKKLIPYFIIAAIGALLGYLLYIPTYGVSAAAWVTVAVEVFIAIGAWNVAQQQIKLRLPIVSTIKILLASILMGAVIMTIPSQSLIVRLIAGIVVYSVSLIAFRVIPLTEIKKILSWS